MKQFMFMQIRKAKTDRYARTKRLLLVGLFLQPLHPFCVDLADAGLRPAEVAQKYSQTHAMDSNPEILELLRTEITGGETERQEHLRRIRALLERTREAWKEVQQATQEVWEKAQKKTREIWRRSQQDSEELRSKALQEIQKAWRKAQIEVQELFRRAQQEVEELWKKAQQVAQKNEKRDLTQDSEEDGEIGRALIDALIFVVPGTDARVPFTDIGSNPDWLKDNIEKILKDRKNRHAVVNFKYNQPWLPGLCTNRKRDCYRANVDKLADAMLKQFAECCKDSNVTFKVVAHSYGAAITFDAIKKLDRDPEAVNIGFRVDRLVTLSPAPLTPHLVLPSNLTVWKNIHGGLGYVDGIGGQNNIQVNIPPEPGKLQAIIKEKRFSLNVDHGAIVNDKRGKEAIRKALAP